ncbi:MAG: rod shape-determining protein MreC [Candidatus Parcubacteria bacterium]|jgi:cell shape-determining protein MreC|nr:rod shape-determining protein MreC [Candidatus Parcubacteria bacterium]
MKRRSYLTTRRFGGGGGGLFSSIGRLVGALVALLILVLLVLRLAAPGLLTSLASPFLRTGQALTEGVGSSMTLDSRSSLIKDRERLIRENEALNVQNATFAARVADLQRLLGNRTERAGGVLAGVLARPPVSPYDVLVVDQGSDAGVRIGATAYGSGGVPLGTVTSADARSARVTLYSHTGNVTEGWAGASRIPVKLTGTGAGGFDAEIPGTAGALVGDEIFVPGPGALPIAVITEVVTDPSSPSVVLRIRSQVNPFSLTWVTIQ